MESQYPQANAVGSLAAGLAVACVVIALFAVVVALTSGNSDHEPAKVAAAAVTAQG